MTNIAKKRTLVLIIFIFFPRSLIGSSNDILDIARNSNEDFNVENNTSFKAEQYFLNCTTYLTSQEFSVLENGSLFLPNQSRILHDDYFLLSNGTAYYCDEDAAQTVATDLQIFSEEFQRCGHILIEPEEYSLLKNNTIYIGLYSTYYDAMNYLIVKSGVYICVPPFEELKPNGSVPYEWAKFSKTSDYVTFIGLFISIICLLTHLIIFCIVPAVRNLPGFCLASLSLSLLMAYICFLIAFVPENVTVCIGLGLSVYYFFLTSFFWMNAIAFDVWRSFRVVVRELRITTNKIPKRRLLMYSLYCWAIPALLTVLVKIFDTVDILPEDFKPGFGHPFCWFGQRKALFIFFAVPLIIVMLLNVAFFIDVVYVINKAAMKSGSAQDDNLRKSFIMFTRLALIMGLTWMFGIAAGFVDKPFLWYIFIVFNTLQGLFIFTIFLGSSKVRNLCYKEYQSRKRSNASVVTISSSL